MKGLTLKDFKRFYQNDPLFKEINEYVKQHEYLLPWYSDIYAEIQQQIFLYGDVINFTKLEDMMREKLIVYP